MDLIDQVIQESSSSTSILTKGTFVEGTQLVSPGEIVTTDPSYMRGHGTFVDSDGKLRATIAGHVEKLNRLVLVRPLMNMRRYGGDVGDVVVGRVRQIGQKRWLLDVNSKQDAVLSLSSIPLPGGIQRRKSEQDELMMRDFFSEGQLVVAEVQTVFHDGALGLHTRTNRKYGKLLAGELIVVPAGRIRRTKTHFLSLEWGVEVILGINGYIWVGKVRTSPTSSATSKIKLSEETTMWEENLKELYSNIMPFVTKDERMAITRTRNLIYLLDRCNCMIDETTIRKAFNASLSIIGGNPFDLLRSEHASTLMQIFN